MRDPRSEGRTPRTGPARGVCSDRSVRLHDRPQVNERILQDATGAAAVSPGRPARQHLGRRLRRAGPPGVALHALRRPAPAPDRRARADRPGAAQRGAARRVRDRRRRVRPDRARHQGHAGGRAQGGPLGPRLGGQPDPGAAVRHLGADRGPGGARSGRQRDRLLERPLGRRRRRLRHGAVAPQPGAPRGRFHQPPGRAPFRGLRAGLALRHRRDHRPARRGRRERRRAVPRGGLQSRRARPLAPGAHAGPVRRAPRGPARTARGARGEGRRRVQGPAGAARDPRHVGQPGLRRGAAAGRRQVADDPGAPAGVLRHRPGRGEVPRHRVLGRPAPGDRDLAARRLVRRAAARALGAVPATLPPDLQRGAGAHRLARL